MKKKVLIIFPLILVFISNVHAQPDVNQFESLQVNSSPGFVILGVEPENIQRPNSPADFVANVQSATINGKLQPNFAMETSPYFWKHVKDDSKKFNLIDYISSNNYWQNLAKSITFSLATSPTDSFTFGKIPGGTGLGFGMHMQLIQGTVNKKILDKLLATFINTRMAGVLDGLINKLEANEDNTIDDVDGWIDDLLATGSFKDIPSGEKEVIKNIVKQRVGKSSLAGKDLAFLRRIRNQAVQKSRNELSKVNDYQFPLTREGFMLEFAFADACVAQNGKWDSLQNAKAAIWITPSYRFNINKDPTLIDFIDIMAVARLTFNSSKVDTTNYLDLGGKLQWIHNRISLSAEGIYRRLTHKPDNQKKAHTFKTGITFSYKLNDLVTFKTTFGSNFDGNSTQYDKPSPLLIVGGFNFGINNLLKPAKK